MEIISKYLLLSLAGACAFLAILPLTTLVAIRFGLVDHPSGRKQHKYSTPLVGGITIFLSFLLVSAIAVNGQFSWTMFFWFALVLLLGVVDDLYDISQKIRLVAHAAIVLGIALTDGHLVFSIGSILDTSIDVNFPFSLALLFTVFAVIGAINSVNMIDGLDGLLGTLVLLTLVALLVAGTGTSSTVFSSNVMCVLIGSVYGFLIVNSRFFGRRSAKVFMGDAGSTVIGFILVYLMISSSQGANAVISPVVAGWLLGLPLLDTSAVIVMRVINRKSVLEPGRDHLHHLLLNHFGSTNKVVATMAVLHIIMISIGLLGSSMFGAYSDVILFWLFVALVPIRCLATYKTDTCIVTKKSRRSFDR